MYIWCVQIICTTSSFLRCVLAADEKIEEQYSICDLMSAVLLLAALWRKGIALAKIHKSHWHLLVTLLIYTAWRWGADLRWHPGVWLLSKPLRLDSPVVKRKLKVIRDGFSRFLKLCLLWIDDICHVTFGYPIFWWVSCFTDDSVAANDRCRIRN